MSNQSKIASLFGSITDTRTKKLALLLIMGYITFKIYRFFQQQDITAFDKSNTNNIIHDEEEKEEKEEKVEKEEKIDTNVANELDAVPRRYIDAKQSKGIPISEEMLIIESSGHTPLNGGYRWFLHDKKWCLFNESSNDHFCLQNGVSIQRIKDKLEIEWDSSIKTCCILSDIDGDIIYYAAPQIDDEYIPNDPTQWIAIRGQKPTPQIFVNLMDKTKEPDTKEQFGNSLPSQTSIQTVFKEIDLDNDGIIDGEGMTEGFKKLGIELQKEQINALIDAKGNDGFTENEFCDEIQKYSMNQENVSFSSVLEKKDNDDNGVIVHKDKEEEDQDDEESQISDLDQ